MAEEPEEVLPEDDVATGQRIEKICMENAVEHQLDQADSDDREGEDQ